jgi:polysaccharide biosynthesis transport protein
MSSLQETAHFLDYWRVIRSRKETVITVFLLTVLAGIGVTYLQPKVYKSSALIQIKKETSSVQVFEQDVAGRFYDPWWIKTQFEIIQSAPVIEEVIRRCNLNEKMGRAYGYLEILGDQSGEETLRRLSRSLKVKQIRDTNLIEIEVYMSKPEESVTRDVAVVANTVAEVYRDQTMGKSREEKDLALKAVKEVLIQQKADVEEWEGKVGAIKEKYKITGLPKEGALSGNAMQMWSEMRLVAKVEFETKKTRMEKIGNLSDGELLSALSYLTKDEALVVLLQEKRKVEIQLSQLLQQLGDKHPDVQRLQQGISETDAKIQDVVAGLKTGIREEFEIARNKYETIELEMQGLKAQEVRLEGGQYLELERATDELNRARALRDFLEQKYVQQNIELTKIPRGLVDIKSPARPPDIKNFVSPNLALNIILSMLVGLFSGVALAYFLEYMDTSIKTIEDIEQTMKCPVLGTVPQRVRLLFDKKADPAHAESYRVLRTNMKFSKKFNGGKSLCVTSGSVGEGKSLTLFNLAYVSAQMGDRVLIVDADMHRPRQHTLLSMPNATGLANVLVGECPLEEAISATPYANLDIMTSGKIAGQVHGLLSTAAMKDLVRTLRESYDMVFFDAPPAMGVSDASMVIREVDGVLMVIQHRKYPGAIAMRARDMVSNIGGNLIGIVLNNINLSKDYAAAHYFHQTQQYYQKKI